MRIAFIGSGNVATVLCRLLKRAGHTITGIYSASAANAQTLAIEAGAASYGTVDQLIDNADIYIIAVNDNAITEISETLKLPGKIVVHTSGSTPQDVLRNISTQYGVLYPLQSLRKLSEHQPVIPLLVNGSDDIVNTQIRALAETVSPIVEDADDEKRLNLHLAAVMVSNFTNFLYTLAYDYCTKQQVPFSALVPLIKEVADRTELYKPCDMQTGPAVRGDSITIEKHLQLLSQYPTQQQVYAQLTEAIRNFYTK